MATGVPKKRRSIGDSRSVANAVRIASASRLEYSGKKPDAEVLATLPAELSPLWIGPSGDIKKRLYFGDNLHVLASFLNDKAVRNKVRLVYIDPPFATQTTFHSRKLDPAYEDTLFGAEFLESLRRRLILLRELLADDGSIYLHLDEKMMFHAKIIMDEVFGPDRYRNCITRKKCNPKNYTRKKFGNVSDYVLFYTKSENYVWNRPVEPWTESRAKEYQYIEPETGRRYMKVPLHAPGVRHGETGKAWRGMLPPPGKHWQYPPKKLDELDDIGEIFWSANGNPRRKVYLDESDGIGVQDIWLDFRDAHNQNIRITGYPTEKNPDLVKRIIEASSAPGDLVLDCYSGSGTTLAVAECLGRNWIGIDNSPEAIKTTLHRFAVGTQPMGDFVTQQQRLNRPHIHRQPTLFDESKEPPDTFSFIDTHSPMYDFCLMSETHSASLVADIVAAWKPRQTETIAAR